MEFSRQEYRGGLHSFSRDLPDPGIEPMLPVSLAMAGRFFTTVPLGKSIVYMMSIIMKTEKGKIIVGRAD